MTDSTLLFLLGLRPPLQPFKKLSCHHHGGGLKLGCCCSLMHDGGLVHIRTTRSPFIIRPNILKWKRYYITEYLEALFGRTESTAPHYYLYYYLPPTFRKPLTPLYSIIICWNICRIIEISVLYSYDSAPEKPERKLNGLDFSDELYFEHNITLWDSLKPDFKAWLHIIKVWTGITIRTIIRSGITSVTTITHDTAIRTITNTILCWTA